MSKIRNLIVTFAALGAVWSASAAENPYAAVLTENPASTLDRPVSQWSFEGTALPSFTRDLSKASGVVVSYLTHRGHNLAQPIAMTKADRTPREILDAFVAQSPDYAWRVIRDNRVVLFDADMAGDEHSLLNKKIDLWVDEPITVDQALGQLKVTAFGAVGRGMVRIHSGPMPENPTFTPQFKGERFVEVLDAVISTRKVENSWELNTGELSYLQDGGLRYQGNGESAAILKKLDSLDRENVTTLRAEVLDALDQLPFQHQRMALATRWANALHRLNDPAYATEARLIYETCIEAAGARPDLAHDAWEPLTSYIALRIDSGDRDGALQYLREGCAGKGPASAFSHAGLGWQLAYFCASEKTAEARLQRFDALLSEFAGNPEIVQVLEGDRQKWVEHQQKAEVSRS